MQSTGPIAFYNTGYHLLFYSLITVHVCLLIDISPLQKKSLCDLNFLIAVAAAALIPAAVTSLVNFGSLTLEISAGTGLAVLSSLLIVLTVQRILDFDIYL